MTSKEIKQIIIDWAIDNHMHHEGGKAAVLDLSTGKTSIQDSAECEDGDYPYVNSLKLVEFIQSL